MDGAVEVFERHLDLERAYDGLHVFFALVLSLDEGVHELLVLDRVHVLETEVLEFGLELVQAEAVGEGDVNVERFLGNLLALLGPHVLHGAHVVDAVGNLDHDDPRVFGHGGNELAVGTGLLCGLARLLDGGNLRDRVHHEGGVLSEFLGNLLEGMRSVFHDVVEQSGEHGCLVLLQVGQDLGDFVGVLGIGHAALAVLSVMCIGDKGNSSLKNPFVQLGILFQEHAYDVLLVCCKIERFHQL